MAEIDHVSSGELRAQFALDEETMKSITNYMFWQVYERIKDRRIVKLKILFISKSFYWRDLYSLFVDLFGPQPSRTMF